MLFIGYVDVHLVLNQLIKGQISDKPTSKTSILRTQSSSHLKTIWEVVRESIVSDLRHWLSRALILSLIAVKFEGQITNIGSGTSFSQAEGRFLCGNFQQKKSQHLGGYSASDFGELRC
jgi:hypothetical protein